MASVELTRVRKEFGGPSGQVAVEDASFRVADGEFVVLVGPSGCGKSTMLRMIAGLETATSGEIRIGDRDVTDVAPRDRDIAMVFQTYALYPHMTVRENMAFGLKLRKMSKAEIGERVERAAGILGIGEILDRRPKQLSGGQRQRVALGRAIVRDPRVFLFDEPLSNLDAKLRVQMRTEISSLHRRLGATMVYVTHDQVEAMTLGDRIVVLDRGVIQQIDTPLALYERPANRFVAGFLGSPAMNFVEGTVEGGDGRERLRFRSDDGAIDFRLPLGWADALAGAVGEAVTLGVRPEALRVDGAPTVEAGPEAGRGGRERTAAPEREAPGVFEAVIDAIEPLGNEIFLHASAGGHRVTARVSPRALPEPGERIRLRLDLDRIHFFDGETEEAVRPSRPEAA